MKALAGEEIADRALSQIGTAFRLHGRTPNVALDCVGLVAHAIDAENVVMTYSLKGINLVSILSYMDSIRLLSPPRSSRICGRIREGDIAIVACSLQQFHLMVRAADGWVHSHAALRKVVHTPGGSPWPIVAVRRMIGD